MHPINLAEKFSLFADHWSPKVIAEMNDYQFKLAKVEGEFVWHNHPDTDEVFFVIEGTLVIELEDGRRNDTDLRIGAEPRMSLWMQSA